MMKVTATLNYPAIASNPLQKRPPLNLSIVRVQAGSCTNLSGGWLRGCELV